MKKHLSLLLLFTSVLLNAQINSYIHTSGKYILGPCNDTLVLKGINYAPYNWGYSIGDLKLDQIAQSGANAVRIVWYANNPGASIYANYAALDSAVSKCVRNKMIAIIELHDFTCQNNSSALTTGAAWWTSSSVLPILIKYKQSIIINIANEALQVDWTANPTTSLAAYKTTYQTIITNLRNVAGFNFPIMIDAPDCGQNSVAFITNNTASDLINFDPLHNIIFSTHAYWYAYANNDSLQMAAKINAVIAQNIPLVLGEIANQQDDATMCQYTLNYKPLLNYCETKKVSWLAWSWDHDGCPARQVSSTGNFANLTAYGNDLVNNSRYGLLTHPAKKSSYLLNNGTCGSITSISETPNEFNAGIFPNPTNAIFNVQTTSNLKSIKIYDIIGHEINFETINATTFKLNQPTGIYFVTIIDEHDNSKILKLVLN